VLVPFDFTDRSGTKWRPAVIVSSDRYNRISPDLLIAAITGNAHALLRLGDHRLRDWQAAGLLRPSMVQTKIATIQASLVGRKLGALTPFDVAALDQGLRLALALQ
jgi:mRNA interferase MazF